MFAGLQYVVSYWKMYSSVYEIGCPLYLYSLFMMFFPYLFNSFVCCNNFLNCCSSFLNCGVSGFVLMFICFVLVLCCLIGGW